MTFALALAAHQAGRLDEAEGLYRDLLREAASFDAIHSYGVLEAQRGRNVEALVLLEEALRLEPRAVAALSNRAHVLSCLGRAEEALASADAALALQPDYAEAHNNRGNALQALARQEEALAAYDEATRLRPAWGSALKNVAGALYRLGRYEESLACCDRILARQPDYFEAINDRAAAAHQLGRHAEALAGYQAAARLNPEYAEARWNEAVCRLLLGDYAGGLPAYEWRWKNAALRLTRREPGAALWLGAEDLRGKRILLTSEQGLGDTLLAARYAPLVAARGAEVWLESFPQIAPLLQTLQGVHRVLQPGDALPPLDFHCPLLSLPLAFGTTLETIPARVPYLAADAGAAKRWREELGEGGEKLVGISWKGSARYGSDRDRSLRLADVAPLLELPGLRFVSLQGELSEEERGLMRELPLAHPGKDFRSTADLVAAMDLVIAVDTAWAHWAGAIGKPVWVMLPVTPYWVWLSEREDSPWYPSARLFRQQRQGDWAPVIERVREALSS
jgi:tetratricopeptide (TPR) repeat protein